MAESKIQQVFRYGWKEFSQHYNPSSWHAKAAHSIMNCKTGKLGCNISICQDCGHMDYHNNSCRNRNCPNCQAILKEVWIDKRKAEVIDSPYFHVVFTVPAQLNPLIYANQKLLYSLLHRCSSETLLELASNPKFLGATPGIIQVLHTWGQELNFHPHIHCIVTGGGLTSDLKLRTCQKGFFIPAQVLGKKFRGKFLALLDELYQKEVLKFSASCNELRNSYNFQEFKNKLYTISWCPDIRETFNGFGNAIEYLGRYTHRIAITNSRIQKVTPAEVIFTAKDYKNNSAIKDVRLTNEEFIRRLMMHVLPHGFQKIRYYGFLCNRSKQKNLKIIFRIQGHQNYRSQIAGLPMDEVLKAVWNYNIHICPICGYEGLKHMGRSYVLRI